MLTIGVICFGSIVGYITYRTLIRTTANAAVSDLATVIGTIGGGAVTVLVKPGTDLFGWYGLGLLIGFIVYATLYRAATGREEFARVMGKETTDTSQRETGAPH